ARLQIADWAFDVAPLRWQTGPNPTMLVMKFCEGTLSGLASDPSLWTMGDYFNFAPRTASQLLQNAISDPTLLQDAPFADAVTRASWNGVLFLNCNVPTAELPPQLRGLQAGIDSPTLVARYLGIAGTPVAEGAAGQVRFVYLQDAPLFGRLDYDNDVDLVYTGKPYDFRVLTLHVRFANSHVVGFSSTVELLVGELFGERSTIVAGEHGDNIIFLGTWQQHNGIDTYAFTYAGDNQFAMDTSAVLAEATLTNAAFATLPQEGDSARVVSLFTIGGSLKFKALTYQEPSTEAETAFDVLSFDHVDVAGFVVKMSYVSGTSAKPEFVFDPTGTVFGGTTTARPGSLFDRLPARPVVFVQSGTATASSGATTPSSLGYMTLINPVATGLDDVWYGLEVDVQLGSAGGLGAALGMTASLIFAWSPTNDHSLRAQLGLRLPGADNGRQYITILGPLRVNVATVSLKIAAGAWLLRAIGVSLQFFSVKFPSNGQIKLEIVTDPNPSGHALGWYGAYQKEAKDGGDGGGGSEQSALPPRRGAAL
ncbi:MAG: hypothetical protein JO057_26680, partial [Chloroflexi bacterium]|nr:hypothetical protein [Chloroflexota bacterium]